MDPNETLRLAREAYARGEYEVSANLYNALDGWMSKQGFKPDAWTANPDSVTRTTPSWYAPDR